MAFMEIDVSADTRSIEEKVENLIDDTVMLEIHNTLAKMCDPYVPFLEGPLSQTVEVTPKSVRYIQPYARYQYYGTDFNFTKDYHPQASAMWDQAMLNEHREEFVEEVKKILARRAKEIG